MSEAGRQPCPLLNVCKKCGQELPNPMDRLAIVRERLRKEFGYGEKCESKQSKG